MTVFNFSTDMIPGGFAIGTPSSLCKRVQHSISDSGILNVLSGISLNGIRKLEIAREITYL